LRGRDRRRKNPWRETRILEPDRVRSYSESRDLLSFTCRAFGDACSLEQLFLGCPAFVPGFPLCGHGRILNIVAADMATCAIFLQQ